MYDGKRLITPETKKLSRPEQAKAKKAEKKLGSLVVESAEGLRWTNSSMTLPEQIEHAHFEAGDYEVEPPLPLPEDDELIVPGRIYTFPVPAEPEPEWIKEAARKIQEQAATPNQDADNHEH